MVTADENTVENTAPEDFSPESGPNETDTPQETELVGLLEDTGPESKEEFVDKATLDKKSMALCKIIKEYRGVSVIVAILVIVGFLKTINPQSIYDFTNFNIRGSKKDKEAQEVPYPSPFFDVKLNNLVSDWSSSRVSAESAKQTLWDIIQNPLYKNHRPNKGIVFIKTHKTGSSTITSVLHSLATSHGLTAAISNQDGKLFETKEAILTLPTTNPDHPNGAPYDVWSNHVVFDEILLNEAVPTSEGKFFSIVRDPGTRMQSVCQCPTCMAMKAIKKPRKIKMDWTTYSAGECIHMDFAFLSIVSVRGFTAFLSVKDAATNYTWTFLTRNKRPPLDIVQFFIRVLKKKHKIIRYLRVDEDGSLANCTEFCALLKYEDIILQTTGGYASNLNGKAESLNKACKRSIATILSAAHMDVSFWCFALTEANHKLRALSLTPDRKMTALQAWTGKRPDWSHFRIPPIKIQFVDVITVILMTTQWQDQIRTKLYLIDYFQMHLLMLLLALLMMNICNMCIPKYIGHNQQLSTFKTYSTT